MTSRAALGNIEKCQQDLEIAEGLPFEQFRLKAAFHPRVLTRFLQNIAFDVR